MADFGDGLAQGPDLSAAAETAVAQATAPLAGRRPDLLALFVCHPDPDVVAEAGARAMEVAGARVAVGCSAGGVIGDARGVEGRPAVSAWAASIPGARLTPFRLDAARSETGGVMVGGMPPRSGDPDEQRAAILLADPFTFPASGFLSKLNEEEDRVPMVGGLAALALSTLLFSFATTLPVLFLARLVQGAADAVTWVVGFALIADLYGPDERGRVAGLKLNSWGRSATARCTRLLTLMVA
jgi:small ligand-binding sensory domain FIST